MSFAKEFPVSEIVPPVDDVDRASSVDDAAQLVARARKVLANGEFAMSARPLLFGKTGVYPQFVAEASSSESAPTVRLFRMSAPAER